MSEPSNGAWPFQEIPEEEGLDISAIFGDSSAAPQGDPFAPPAAAQSVPSSPTPVAQEITPAVAATSQPTTAPIAKAPVEAPAENPIAAAFEQKTAENTKKGLLEKPPVFYHKGVKEEIDDPSMTFEELRIRKSDDFTDLEEGKRVSWSVEYCGIRKEVKDPKGTTIISMKEMIERSREFLDALKKTKDKAPCCYVKPKVEMKTKGNAAYKGKFGTLEEARNSDNTVWVEIEKRGRSFVIKDSERARLDNAYLSALKRLGLTPAAACGIQSLLTPKTLPGQTAPEENAPAASPQPKQGNSQPAPASALQIADQPATRSDSQQTQPVQQSRAAASRTVPFGLPQSAARQRTDCYVVLSTKVQGGMSGSSTLVTLRAPDGKQIPAFARGARPELSTGTVLSNVKLTMRQQDTVAFYVLESYEIVPQEDRAA